ncbi:MAG: hypothetical protein EBW52_02970, partial [Betaproteobacteria bacterium]|nr:hypothetical protein [Betaproteobacteria bacterium]
RRSGSIGLAPNKLLAKLASELEKPMGLSQLHSDSVQAVLWPLPVSRLHGVGPRTAEKLKALGLDLIGQLAKSDPASLQARFGASHGRWLIEASWGIDERPMVLASEPISISRETTLERDMHPSHDRQALSERFTALCHQLAADLQAKQRLCRSVSVKIRNDQFKTSTRDVSFAEPTDDPARIRSWAGQCLKRFVFDRRIRLLGVKATRLSPRHLAATALADALRSNHQAATDPEQLQPVAASQHALWPELEPALP